MLFCQPCIQGQPALGNAARRVVCYVIGVTHECVNGTQGIPLLFRKRQEPIVKVLCPHASDTTANRISVHKLRVHSSFPRAARATSASFRDLELVGRQRKTSKFCRSIAFSISCPPRLNSSMSIASSRSTLSTRGRPRSNQSR